MTLYKLSWWYDPITADKTRCDIYIGIDVYQQNAIRLMSSGDRIVMKLFSN